MSNFDLRKFLTENKLTSNTRLLKEEADLKSFDGQEGSFLGKVDYWNIYSLEGSSVNDTMMYALVSSEEEEIVSIDVAGEEVSLDQIKQDIEGRGMSDKVAQFLLDDINSQLENEGSNELQAIKAKLEADPKNEYLNFIFEPERDRIRVGGREGAKHDFVLRNEKENFGSYQLFDVDDEDRGMIVSIIRKK